MNQKNTGCSHGQKGPVNSSRAPLQKNFRENGEKLRKYENSPKNGEKKTWQQNCHEVLVAFQV